VNYLIATLFFLFAALQYNDPDPFIWIPLYAIIGLVFMIKSFTKNILLIIMALYMFYMLTYIPDFLQWVKDGAPTITSSMKASNPEVELMREFFGIILCIGALWYRTRRSDL
jgi:hypothetical protein